MAALRAMLQLRSGPSSPHLSAIHSHSDAHAHHASTLPLSNTAPYTSSVLSAPLLSPMAGISGATKQSGSSANKKALNLGLHSGAASGNLGLVKFALDNGQPIDSVLNGVLPIHAACCSNANVPVVLFLIDRGADVNARRHARKYNGEKAQSVGTTGSTPLHFAAANGCLTIVEILLRHGAIADSADKYGTTPFMVATARNHPDVASVLHQHSSMQRGIQVLTPEADLRDTRERDLFTSPRSSGDFSRRVSAIMAPTRSSGILQKESTSTSLAPQTSPPQITTAISTATATMSRSIVSQRRVSLPCIIESPTSPTGPATPRHSCDLGRSPIHAEPLHTRTTSGAMPMRRDCMPATPKTNTVSAASLLTTQPQTSAGHQLNSNTNQQTSKQKSASLQQRSPLDKVAASSGLFAGAPEAISNNVSRRRSIDISALSGLSSRTSLHLRRQKSLDLLRASQAPVAVVAAEVATVVPDATASSTDPAVTDREDSRPPLESKVRRDSDASTSETIASGQSSCTTLVTPMVQALDDGKPAAPDSMARPSSDLGQETSPMARSASQPPLSHTSVTAARRSVSASEPGVRQSFDLRLFAGRDRLGMEDAHEGLNKNRRRSIHDPLFTMKKEPDFGPGLLLGISNSPRNETLSHLSRKGSSSSSSSSSSSKNRGSFSGSATVSGRFSRFLWYGSDHQVKDPAAASSLSNGPGPGPGPGPDHSFWSSGLCDLAEASSAEAASQEIGERKARNGMMNRLSGIWSRR